MHSPHERFDILLRFLGFGNPAAPLWFIGLEEAAWQHDHERDYAKYQRYARGHFGVEAGEMDADRKSYGRRYTRVYDIESKFAVSLFSEHDPSLEGWREYRDHSLLTAEGDTFQMNLFPLGKKSLKTWPQHYASVFGISSRGFYLAQMRDTRFRVLREAHRKFAPRFTICFGKYGWDDFLQLFQPNDAPIAVVEDCQIYQNGIVLCPFFQPRFLSDKRILCLARSIRVELDGVQHSCGESRNRARLAQDFDDEYTSAI